MKQFVSFSKHPSNNGKYFYTNFFKLHNINAEYHPLAATEDNIHDMIKHAVSQGVTGISISMPFKQQVLTILDYAETDVIKYNSCNTIVVVDNKLHGYNTDIRGVIKTCSYINSSSVDILGDGAMAGMYYKYLLDENNTINMYSRKLKNWDRRNSSTGEVVINCTGVGTINDESPLDTLENRKLVIDLAIKEKELYKQCFQKGIKYISGMEFYKHQFFTQYKLYTGTEVSSSDFDQIENIRSEN
jgi:shikimate 5-dehydrogenase